MAFNSPSFLSRLARPFVSSSRMGISSESTSAAAESIPAGAQKATVAAGCFWGVEHIYRKHFGNGKGLLDAKVGYIGGDLTNPSYKDVCSGKSGRTSRPQSQSHWGPSRPPDDDLGERATLPRPPCCLRRCDGAKLTAYPDAEATQIIFDPTKVTYRQLLEFFYKMHDPTTANKQGPDTGPQYRSGIYFHDEEQERISKEVTQLASEKWWKGKIVTEILPAGRWWDAEEYHQLYLDKNPWGYECPSHFIRNFPPLE